MKLLNYLFFNMFGSVFGVLWVNWCHFAVVLANKMKNRARFLKIRDLSQSLLWLY